MSLQMIKSTKGELEYVLLPVTIYHLLRYEITQKMKEVDSDYVPFDPADYVNNPVALARINADVTQQELADKMTVTQAYISKIERQDTVSAKVLKKVKEALARAQKRSGSK